MVQLIVDQQTTLEKCLPEAKAVVYDHSKERGQYEAESLIYNIVTEGDQEKVLELREAFDEWYFSKWPEFIAYTKRLVGVEKAGDDDR